MQQTTTRKTLYFMQTSNSKTCYFFIYGPTNVDFDISMHSYTQNMRPRRKTIFHLRTHG